MDRARVVDAGLDACRLEVGEDAITALDAHGVQMPGVLVIGRGPWAHDAVDVVEEVLVSLHRGPPVGVPGLEVPQLRSKHDGLEAVESRVDTRDAVLAAVEAVVVQRPYPRGEVGVVGEDGPAVPVRSEVLPGIEARGRGTAYGARAPTVLTRTVRLRGILDDDEIGEVGETR